MSVPDVIYTCRHVGEYGSYYPEAVDAEGEYGGEAVAYVPRDLLTAMTAERDALQKRVLSLIMDTVVHEYGVKDKGATND